MQFTRHRSLQALILSCVFIPLSLLFPFITLPLRFLSTSTWTFGFTSPPWHLASPLASLVFPRHTRSLCATWLLTQCACTFSSSALTRSLLGTTWTNLWTSYCSSSGVDTGRDTVSWLWLLSTLALAPWLRCPKRANAPLRWSGQTTTQAWC